MKIIGTAGSDSYRTKFLLEATEEEIAGLFGLYGSELREQSIKIEPGLVIKVNEEFCKLQWLRRRAREFSDLTKKLRETADAIDASEPAFENIVQQAAL